MKAHRLGPSAREASAPRPRRDGGDGVPAACLVAFLAVWLLLAISPRSRADWVLENLPTFAVVPALIATVRRFRFSDRAYVQGAIFLVLHTIGSHYTYSEVPFGAWASSALDLARNHYDRLVHFSAGLLLLRPVRELAFHRRGEPGPVATLLLPVCGVAAGSALYEIVEWCVAAVADPAAGIAYLGTQGDVWDAQKDMALAGLGALAAAAAELWLDPPRRRARDKR